MNKIIEKKKLEEQAEMAKPQEDKLTVKLKNLTNDTSEDDIWNAMAKFGKIMKVKIPMDEHPGRGRRRNKGFAFVTFESEFDAEKALKEGEVTVEFSTLEIEKAMKRVMPPRESYGGPGKEEFKNLTRSKN